MMLGVTIGPAAARSLSRRPPPWIITQPVDRDANGMRSGALVNKGDRVAIIDADRQTIFAVADAFNIVPIISRTDRIPDGPGDSAYIEVDGGAIKLHIDMGLTDAPADPLGMWDEIGMGEFTNTGVDDFTPGREAWWLLAWFLDDPIPIGPGALIRTLPKHISKQLEKARNNA